MHLESLNVGLPRTVEWRRRLVSTGIFKEPVAGRRHVMAINIQGDRQADLDLHGGRDKAVYAYPAEHYPLWEAELDRRLPWGMFGENLTIAGAPLEDDLAIGDRLRVGSAQFEVTQPRLPCFKLGIRFDDPGMVRRFLEAERTGYYLRVTRPGEVEAGDEIEILERDPSAVAVAEITRVFTRDRHDAAVLRRVLTPPALADDLRHYFEQLLEQSAESTDPD